MPWVFMGYPSGWGENVVGADIQKYLDGSMSWEDLVKNAQKHGLRKENKIINISKGKYTCTFL